MASGREQSVFWRVGQMKRALFPSGCSVKVELELELELEFEAQGELESIRVLPYPELVE